MGEFEDDEVPEAMRRLISPVNQRTFDVSGMGTGDDPSDDNAEATDQQQSTAGNVQMSDDGCIILRTMTMEAFRRKLIQHFDIAFAKKEIHWPKRLGVVPSF
jgi:hypothetical protein